MAQSTQTNAENVKKLHKPENQNKTVKVYFGIFFDGTMNHREQAIIGENYREKEQEKKSLGLSKKELKKELKEIKQELGYKGSRLQENDQSNVALLFPVFNEKSEEHVCRMYVTGIGTEDDGSTSILVGGAFGKGDTGIVTKVEKAITQIPAKIAGLQGIGYKDNIELYFELFGFSRGAAAARRFVWNVMEKNKTALTEKLKPKNLNSIKINYVGLFDTVSSFGLNLFSDNDVDELHLDAIRVAKYVYHICAADEFRKNFALTDISSAKGKEIFIPGAHSDIGGGYPAGEYSVTLEMDLLPNKTVDDMNTVVTQESLMHLGWIRDTPVKNYNIYHLNSPNEIQSEYIQFKNTINKGYSYIGLELMAENANSNRANMFEPIRQQYKTPSQLTKMKGIANNSISLGTCQSLFNPYYKEFDLRKYWLHFSSNDGDIGMGPRKENGILRRNIIPG